MTYSVPVEERLRVPVMRFVVIGLRQSSTLAYVVLPLFDQDGSGVADAYAATEDFDASVLVGVGGGVIKAVGVSGGFVEDGCFDAPR
jgi:hypothetical protein